MPSGHWWAVFLGIRYAEGMFHNLGRETFLAPVTWDADGWPVVHGGHRILTTMEAEHLPPLHALAGGAGARSFRR